MQMGMKQLLSCLLAISAFSGCAVLSKNTDLVLTQNIEPANILDLQSQELADLPPAKIKPIIAVYANSFQDLTGQRKSNSRFSFKNLKTLLQGNYLKRKLKKARRIKYLKK